MSGQAERAAEPANPAATRAATGAKPVAPGSGVADPAIRLDPGDADLAAAPGAGGVDPVAPGASVAGGAIAPGTGGADPVAPGAAIGADPMGDARRRRADRARQVADVLRRQVLAGVFAGRTLPGEPRLAADFGVSRNAVRAALDLLRAEGLLDRVPGVGTVPATPKYPHGLDGLLGLGEVMRGHGEVSNEVRTTGIVTPPAPIAARLDVPPGSPVIYIERLRTLAGLPLSLDLTYLVPDIGQPLLGEDLAHQDIFGLIERLSGQRLGLAELTIEAISADPHSAAVLETPPSAALLMVERLTHLADGRPVDLEYIRFRGDRLAMHGWLQRGS